MCLLLWGSNVSYQAHVMVGQWPVKSWDFATKFQSGNVSHDCQSINHVLKSRSKAPRHGKLHCTFHLLGIECDDSASLHVSAPISKGVLETAFLSPSKERKE